MNTEDRTITIVRHPASALLKEHASSFFEKHDFDNHANLLVQKLTKCTFRDQETGKRLMLELKTRNSGVALKI